jgi:tyrosine-protein kinase Etk/Wzc
MSTVNPNPNVSALPPTPPTPRELDLFKFFMLLLVNWRLILTCGALAFSFMLVKMLITKPLFKSSTAMIVPQGNVTAASLVSKLSSSTADLLGGGYELYGDILRSRVVADQLIKDHHLVNVYEVKDVAGAEGLLAARTDVKTTPEGLIRVSVEDTDAQRAADIANDYLHQLDVLNGRLVLTSVSEERAFFEREMYAEKDRLADAEVALEKTQVQSNGLPPEVQATAGVTALISARAELRADQIRLAALLTGATEQNPEVIRVRTEIASLSSQVEGLQKGEASTVNGIPTSQMPVQELEYIRRKRDVTFHETLFELLEKEYETAKQEEAKTPSIVQVLDPAIPANHKAWPPRTLYCLLAGIAGILLGMFLVGAREIVRTYFRNPQNAGRLQQLKTSWRKSAQA